MEGNNALANKNKQSMNQFFYDPSQGIYKQMPSVNLSIPVPAESILISKFQLEELKKSQLQGVYLL